MFSTAVAIAQEFTRPVILSRRAVSGGCSATVGAFVVVNRDGWILTAHHIIQQWHEMTTQAQEMRDWETERARIGSDSSIDDKERRRRLSKLKKPKPQDTDRCSAWWADSGARLVQYGGIPSVDIGVGRLEPFDPAWITRYPTFRDPKKGLPNGTSLCKLGFPFATVGTTYDAAADRFRLTPGSVPLPMFPLDGIFTRTREVVVPGAPPPPYPMLQLEMSTPGLKGQSGGPIFDAKGDVWAIQSATDHLPLGFDPKVPGSLKGQREFQFLNVGLGVHPITILAMLDQAKVAYTLS